MLYFITEVGVSSAQGVAHNVPLTFQTKVAYLMLYNPVLIS